MTENGQKKQNKTDNIVIIETFFYMPEEYISIQLVSLNIYNGYGTTLTLL